MDNEDYGEYDEYEEEDYGGYDNQNNSDSEEKPNEGYSAPTFEPDDDVPLPAVSTAEEILAKAVRPEGYETFRKDDEENLEDDFASTPWVPPTISKAKEHRNENLFRGGSSSICTTTLCNAADLGTGTSMYFQFLKSMTVCLFLMTILSVPCIVFAFSGSRIPVTDRDITNLYMLTLGNIGYNPASPTYTVDSTCKSVSPSGVNETCIHVFGLEYSLVNASSVLTACEILQILVFFITICHVHRKTLRFEKENDRLFTSVTSYAVMVLNVPHDCAPDELVLHFSHLYPLDGPDWRGRPALMGARPVQSVSRVLALASSALEPYNVNTWVAECTLYRRLGKYIRKLRRKELLDQKLRRSRATMKMYANDTPHHKGPNEKKHAQAEKKMLSICATIDAMCDGMVTKKALKGAAGDAAEGAESKEEGREGDRPLDKKGLERRIKEVTNILGPLEKLPQQSAEACKEVTDRLREEKETLMQKLHDLQLKEQVRGSLEALDVLKANACAAFITFEYPESRARCLEDQSTYSTFPRTLCYPSKLLFRGRHRLTILPAPEPNAVVYENLEVSSVSKVAKRLRTLVVGATALVVCFVVLLQASLQKQAFDNLLPPNVCNADIPELFAISSNLTKYESLVWARPPVSQQKAYDQLCAAAVKSASSVYAVYSTTSNFDDAVGRYDVSVCSASTSGMCPHYGQSVFCPCVTTSTSSSKNAPGSEVCDSASCSRSPYGDANPQCKHFKASSIGNCYCMSQLSSFISSNGVLGTLQRIRESNSGSDPCAATMGLYSTSLGLTYIITLTTVVVNAIGKYLIKMCVRHEAHLSLDAQEASTSFKIFVFTYINMALVVFVAFCKIDGLPKSAQQLQLFQGTFTDFNSAWYASVGSFLVITFVLQALVGIVPPLWGFYVGAPFKRWIHYFYVSAQSSRSKIIQDDVNKLEVGPVFHTSSNISQMLALLFFAMTFAAGLPALMLVGFFAFLIYFNAQKLLICHYFRRPPRLSSAMIKNLLSLLPFAALIRLMFSVMMLGSPDLLPPSIAQVGTSTSVATSQASKVEGADSVASSAGNQEISSATFERFMFMVLSHVPTSLSPVLVWTCRRMFRANVFLLALLFGLILTTMVIRALWKHLPFYWIMRGLTLLRGACGGGKRGVKVYLAEDDKGKKRGPEVCGYDLMQLHDPLRLEIAPFSGEYFSYIRKKGAEKRRCAQWCGRDDDDIHFTAHEVEEGWLAVDDEEFVLKRQQWHRTAMIGGITRTKGDFKRTYEVVKNLALNSYSLEKVPSYQQIILALAKIIKNFQECRIKCLQTAYKEKKEEFTEMNNKNPFSAWGNTDVARQGDPVVPFENEDSDDDDSDDDDDDDD